MEKKSKLCLNCPNFNENWPNDGDGSCPGFYLRNAEDACLTYKSWRGGNLTYQQALEAKNRQHQRHQETDEFRRQTYHLILKYQQPQDDKYLKEQARDLAHKIAKGKNAFSLFKQARETSNLYLPQKLCRAIEENRRCYT